jgi:hypothetical protein
MSHIYHITPDDLDRFETLEPSDVGRPYVLVAGCIHFVDRALLRYRPVGSAERGKLSKPTSRAIISHVRARRCRRLKVCVARF